MQRNGANVQRKSTITSPAKFTSTSNKDKHQRVTNDEDEDEDPIIWTPVADMVDKVINKNQSFYAIEDEEQIDEDEDPSIWAEDFKMVAEMRNEDQSMVTNSSVRQETQMHKLTKEFVRIKDEDKENIVEEFNVITFQNNESHAKVITFQNNKSYAPPIFYKNKNDKNKG